MAEGSCNAWHVTAEEGRLQDVGSEGDAYARLLSAVLIPRVASAVVNEWEPRDCEPMLQWVEGWSHLLPPMLLRHVLQHLVFPKVPSFMDFHEITCPFLNVGLRFVNVGHQSHLWLRQGRFGNFGP